MKTSLDKNSPLREKVEKVEAKAKERLAERERQIKEKKEGVGKIV
jgi:DNA-binding protein H-NS